MTVWLGMPKAEAVKKFSDAGYEVLDTGDGIIASAGNENHDMRFTNGRLVYADIGWYNPHTNSNTAEIDAALGALSALADKGNSRACFLSHEPTSHPDMQADRVFVRCGSRSVLILSGKMNGEPVVDVLERIGDIPTSPKQ